MARVHVFVIGLLIILEVYGLILIPERAEIKYVNEKYLVNNVSLQVRKQCRGCSDYVAHFNAYLLKSLENNVSIRITTFEFMHNEYKPTFVELNFKTCQLINQDKFIGTFLRRYGLTSCPVPVGPLIITNASFVFNNILDKFPFNKFKADIDVYQNVKQERIILGVIYFQVKAELKKKNN